MTTPVRHCLKIPFTISATNPNAIIGGACAGDAIWDVPCTVVSFADQANGSGDYLDPGDVTVSFGEPVEIEV